ncbi:MAG: sugar phosphate isomerase/epimerase [Dictyoglomaceae bacterium]|nr:sugar phosphate isomerase/epimerase [Dictyoglomaceae bacterium]
MKFSLVITTKDAIFNALTFKGDLIEGIKIAKKLGYSAVELAVRDPKIIDYEEILRILKEENMIISAIGTGRAFTEEGLFLSSFDKEIREKAIKRIKEDIDLAGKFNSFVIIGLIRGKPEDKEKALRILKESIIECGEYAKMKGVKILIEPINSSETTILNKFLETYNFIDELGLDNLGILADTYHINKEEKSIYDSFTNYKDKIWYVHVSDDNRGIPGTGNLNFSEVFKALKDINYDGYISLECVSNLTIEETGKRNLEFLNKFL